MSGEFLSSDNIVAAVIGALITVLFAPLVARFFHRQAKLSVKIQSLPKFGHLYYGFLSGDIFKQEGGKNDKEKQFFQALLQASYLVHVAITNRGSAPASNVTAWVRSAEVYFVNERQIYSYDAINGVRIDSLRPGEKLNIQCWTSANPQDSENVKIYSDVGRVPIRRAFTLPAIELSNVANVVLFILTLLVGYTLGRS